MTPDFYAAIPAVHGFEELAHPDVYRPAPNDWYIACADIAGSTSAIAEGKYKAVNTVGVAAITALRNVAKPMQLPYVFGGDGAVVLVPGPLHEAARSALAGTVAMAERGFGLDLRAAVVPIEWVRGHSLEVLVARQQVSEHYVQAALFGGGADWVEAQLKSGQLPAEFTVTADAGADVDFGGLECRWKEIPSPGGETVAVIVEAGPAAKDHLTLFRWVMEQTREIYGDDAACRPVDASGLRVALTGPEQTHESAVRDWRDPPRARWFGRVRQRLWVTAGWLLMTFGIRAGDFEWPKYRRELIANTDFRKFDGVLRFVLSGTPEQRERLERFLTNLSSGNVARYGIHVAGGALMTCVIDERKGAHFHFVDAAGGGYAAAAAAMKASRPSTSEPAPID